MAVLPIGFFMPLPLPIMIPFMMWQSAAIAAGFGTYFQFAKRRVSAMSNEEFNKADPHELVNSMYEDIVKSIPDSFAKVDSLTPVILQSMNVMLDQAVKWLANVIKGNIFDTPSQPTLPTDTETVLPDTELLTLTIQFIATMNDLSLQATINNITDYDEITRQLLIAEQDRRIRLEEEQVEKPSTEQESTKLNPEFIATLTKSDLEIGGARTRNYKGTLMKWKGTDKVFYSIANHFITYKWISNKWVIQKNIIVGSLSNADKLVNELKVSVGAAYVITFRTSVGETYFLIKDNF